VPAPVVKLPFAVDVRFDAVVLLFAMPRLVSPVTSGLSDTSVDVFPELSTACRLPMKFTIGR